MSHRINPFLACLFIAAGCLYGCKPDDEVIKFPSDQVAIKVATSARISWGLTIWVNTIFDSRCPIGYNCLLAGDASASITVGNETDLQTRKLVLDGSSKDRRDLTTVQFQNITYKVILQDVTPYPSSKNLRPEQQAIIQVSRL